MWKTVIANMGECTNVWTKRGQTVQLLAANAMFKASNCCWCIKTQFPVPLLNATGAYCVREKSDRKNTPFFNESFINRWCTVFF